jgi:DnaJ-class molecular chaperone
MRLDEACKVLLLPAKGQVTEAQLRQAYKKACLKHHPDRNLGDEENAKVRFQAVGDAFQILERHIKRSSSSSSSNNSGTSNSSSSSSSSRSGNSGGKSASNNHSGSKGRAPAEDTYAAESGDESEDDAAGNDDDEDFEGFEFQEMFRQHFGSRSEQEISEETRAFFDRMFSKAEAWDRRSYIKQRRKYTNAMSSPEALLQQMKHEQQLAEQRAAEARKAEEKARAEAEARNLANAEGRDW